MKKWLLCSLIILTGCGGLSKTLPPPSTITINWQDGNPTIPACGSVNCKSGWQILDNGKLESLPLSTTSYIGVASHTYQIRATGLDGKGNPLYSSYVAVP